MGLLAIMNEASQDPEDRRLILRGPMVKSRAQGPVLRDVPVVHTEYYA